MTDPWADGEHCHHDAWMWRIKPDAPWHCSECTPPTAFQRGMPTFERDAGAADAAAPHPDHDAGERVHCPCLGECGRHSPPGQQFCHQCADDREHAFAESPGFLPTPLHEVWRNRLHPSKAPGMFGGGDLWRRLKDKERALSGQSMDGWKSMTKQPRETAHD